MKSVIVTSIIATSLTFLHPTAIKPQEGGDTLRVETIALKTNIPNKPIAYKTALIAKFVPGSSNCGDNQYANYIYMHESGCSTYNPNPTSGSCGLGQAWPCQKMPCGHSASDYDCQNSWFNQYAIERYGSWYNAYIYWQGHGNW